MSRKALTTIQLLAVATLVVAVVAAGVYALANVPAALNNSNSTITTTTVTTTTTLTYSVNTTTSTSAQTSTTTTTAPSFQTIGVTMPVGWPSGTNVTYARTLQAGEAVNGTVKLTGTPQSRDASYTFYFRVYAPNGSTVYDWTGDWMNSYYQNFSFTAASAGSYKIVVTHFSQYPKDLTIQISAPGWV